MSERPLGGVRKDQTRVARDIDRLAMYCDDRAVPQLAEDLALLADAVVASRVGCDFQDALLGVGVAHEQRDGSRAAAEAPDDLEPRDAVTRLSGERMDLLGFVVLLRFGELLLDEGDPVDEICDRGGPLGRVARRCVTDEGGEVLAGAVEDRRDLQGPVSLEAVGQRCERGRRRLTGEDVVGDRPEREDVQELGIGVGDRERLGGQVGRGVRIDELIDMTGALDGARERAAAHACACLPVDDAEALLRCSRAHDEDAARGQGAVRKPATVRRRDRLSEVADQGKTIEQAQGAAALVEVVVKADLGWVALEHEGRPKLVLVEVHRVHDARVLHRCEELELALGGARDLLALERISVGGAVDPHTAMGVFRARVDGGEILVAGSFVEQFLQFEVADFPCALGWPDARLLKRLRYAPGHGLVDATPAESGVLVWSDASDHVDDAGEPALLNLDSVVILTEASDAVPAARIQAAVQFGMRQKDERGNVGELLAAERRLTTEQRLEALGLAVGQQEGVVVAALSRVAGGRATPRAGVAADDARPALDLDEEDALRADDEDIDFADRAVEQELEVRPRSVRLVVGQTLLEERQRVALPRELGRGDLDPRAIHDQTSSSSRGWRRRMKSPNSGAV